MAEQFGLDQVARDRRHVDGDERPVAALAVIMQRARDQFLAGAGFAGDHHRQVGLHQPRQHAVDSCIAASGRPAAWPVVRLGRSAARALRFGSTMRARDDGDQFGQVEGLRQIFIGARSDAGSPS
jgi:hypothetical protein